MTTPEAKVKGKVKTLLSRYVGLYAYWPVPSGYGRTTIDCIGCYRGRFFAIETKADGKKPTLRQVKELQDMGLAMGKTFVIAGVDDPALGQLRDWLTELGDTIDNDPYLPPDPVDRRPL